MSFFGWANQGIESTQRGVVSVADTTTLLAEVDLNGSNASVKSGGEVWGVTWIVANETTAVTFCLNHTLSTAIHSTGIINQTIVCVSSANSAQFFTKHNVERGHRFSARSLSSKAGNAAVKIIAEPLV